MAGSASRQDEANPVFLLATRAGKMGLSCLFGISRRLCFRKSEILWSNLLAIYKILYVCFYFPGILINGVVKFRFHTRDRSFFTREGGLDGFGKHHLKIA